MYRVKKLSCLRRKPCEIVTFKLRGPRLGGNVKIRSSWRGRKRRGHRYW